MDVTEAVSNASRLLEACELETDLGKMERLTALADSWVTVAVLLSERERA